MYNPTNPLPPYGITQSHNQKYLQRFICAAIAAILTYIIGQEIFWGAVLTTDEHAYLMQAFTFLEGKISRPLPPLPEIFRHEMMIMDESAGWLSRYPPAHSLWLIIGILAGTPHLAVSLAAGLSVWIFSSTARPVNLHPLLLAAIMVFSPYFLMMNGTLLSHTSALPASCLMLWAYISWKITKNKRYAFIAGMAWSWLFLNRTYTGLLIALPYALDAIFDLARNRDRANFTATLLFVLSAASGGMLYLAYNYLAIGDPFTPTYLYYAPDDHLGFGLRSTSSIAYNHSLDAGLLYLKENMLLLNQWLFGFTGSLLVAGALVVFGWHKRWSPLCLGVFVSVAVGYVFFWWRGVRDVGPVYYFETLPYILLATAFGLDKLLKKAASRQQLIILTASLTLLLLVSSSYFVYKQGGVLRERQRIVGEFHRLIRTAPAHSIIMVSGFRGMRHVEKGTSYNPGGIDSDPLLIAAGSIAPEKILKQYPGRKPFVMIRQADQLLLEPYKP
jgi:hypothetical protein